MSLLKNIIGFINLSAPIIVAYRFFPDHILQSYSIGLCSALIGSYITYIHYKQAQSLQTGLKYAPTDAHLEAFRQEISNCGMNPDSIHLRYGYANDNIAVTNNNTICIDPIVWKGIEDDKDAIAVKDIIERQVLPTVPEAYKKIHQAIHTNITPDTQRFIFRHELGHIYNKTSFKMLCAIFVIGATATAFGMSSAAAILNVYGGIAAIIGGILIGGVSDISLSYINNASLKTHEEQQADYFAAQFCTAQELESAADFFEKYEIAAREFRKNCGGLTALLPSRAVTGYPSSRVANLRTLTQKKTA